MMDPKSYKCTMCGKECKSDDEVLDHERPHLVCYDCLLQLPDEELQMPDDAFMEQQNETERDYIAAQNPELFYE